MTSERGAVRTARGTRARRTECRGKQELSSPRNSRCSSPDGMKQLALTRDVHHYHEAKRRPDARLFAVGELVRFPERENQFGAGTVLRVAGVDGPNQIVHLRRKNGETLEWKPSATAQIFSRSDGEVRPGTILEWSG